MKKQILLLFSHNQEAKYSSNDQKYEHTRERMIRVGFLLLLCTGAFAPTPTLPLFEACPKIIPTKNFVIEKFVGPWFKTHEIISFPKAGKCTTLIHSLNSDGSLQMILRQITFDSTQPVTTQGSAIFLSNTNGPTFISKFPKRTPGIVWILDTDNKTYTIVSTCADVLFGNVLNVFVLQKQRKTTAAIRKQIHKVFDQYKLNISALHEIDHDNCPVMH